MGHGLLVTIPDSYLIPEIDFNPYTGNLSTNTGSDNFGNFPKRFAFVLSLNSSSQNSFEVFPFQRR